MPSVVDGCGTAAQTVLRRCLRLLRRVACCSLRWRRTRLVTRQGLMLCRDVRRMRPGGEGACVTTLLEMPFGVSQRLLPEVARHRSCQAHAGALALLLSTVQTNRHLQSDAVSDPRCVARPSVVSRIDDAVPRHDVPLSLPFVWARGSPAIVCTVGGRLWWSLHAQP